MWIDFHSHCLPAIDDGAADVTASLKMIDKLIAQGVDTVTFTPHFEPYQNKISAFLVKRDAALQKLLTAAKEQGKKLPNILLGAEIYLEAECSDFDLSALKITGTNAMLLEFPYTTVKPWMINEIENIAGKFRITPIIAHVERYYDIWRKSDYDAIFSLGNAIYQVNTDAFANKKLREQFLKWHDDGMTFILGSDAHDPIRRPPYFDVVEKYRKKSQYKDFFINIQEISINLLHS